MGKDKSEKKEKKRKAEVIVDAPAGVVEIEDATSVRFLTIKMCISQSHPGSAYEENKKRQGRNRYPPRGSFSHCATPRAEKASEKVAQNDQER